MTPLNRQMRSAPAHGSNQAVGEPLDGVGVVVVDPLVADLDYRTPAPQRCRCIVCYSRCYGFDDGEDDPRGVLTERHCVMYLDPRQDAGLVRSADPERDAPPRIGADGLIVICWRCSNDGSAWEAALRAAMLAWRRLGWRLP